MVEFAVFMTILFGVMLLAVWQSVAKSIPENHGNHITPQAEFEDLCEKARTEYRERSPAPADFERIYSNGPIGRWYPSFDDQMGTGFTGVAMTFGLMGGTIEFREDGTGNLEEWRGDTTDFEWKSVGHCRIETTMQYPDCDEDDPDEDDWSTFEYTFGYSRGGWSVVMHVNAGCEPFAWMAPYYRDSES